MTDDASHGEAGSGASHSETGSGANPSAPDRSDRDDDTERQMAAALTEIRREVWKAAVTTGVVDAVVVFLATNLVLAALDPPWLPNRIQVPRSVAEQVGPAVGRDLGAAGLPGSATVAAGVGVLAFVVAVWVRVRKPLVEQFEAVNPHLAEKLRTARDAVAADSDSRMARRLYAEVLADLRDSSSFGLVNVGRLGAMAVVVAALSLATVQVAVLDLALLDRPEPTVDDSTDEAENYTGLLDGERVLGDREEVSVGDDNQTAEIESTGGGRDVDEDRNFPDQERRSGTEGSSSSADSQQAEFAAPDQVEDADLVREYNRRIRDQDAQRESGDDTG